MKIKIKKLLLENFMAYPSAMFDFYDFTRITSKNGKGKSSIANAYTWLFFNCDYELHDNPAVRRIVDRKSIDDMDVSVTAIIDMDGKEVTAKKVQRRSYSKDGIGYKDDNKYFINDVPKTLTAFNQYFAIDMEAFKMCSNINAFLSQKASDMREFLFGLVEDVTDLSIAKDSHELSELAPLLEKYTKEELEAMQKATKAKITKELPLLDGQIKEKERDVVTKSNIDVSALELLRNKLKEQLAENTAKQVDVDKLLQEWQQQSDDILELKFKQSELQQKANADVMKKRSEIRTQLNQLDSQVSSLIEQITTNKQDIQRLEKSVADNEEQRKIQAEIWLAESNREFDETSLNCPYCGQKYPDEKQEQMRDEFNSHKSNELKKITDKGMDLKLAIDNGRNEIERLTKLLEENEALNNLLNQKIRDLETEYDAIPISVDISASEEYQALQKQIEEKEHAMQQEYSAENIRKELKSEENHLREKLSECEMSIAKADVVEDKNRLEKLRMQKLDLEQSKADAEKILSLLDDLDRLKNNMLSNAINHKFSFIDWKLWELNKSGGYKNVCIPMVGGKSILDLASNKGNRILGRIDICNSIQRIRDIHCPIWLDDCESLDEENQKKAAEMVDGQLIMLIVNNENDLQINGGCI